MWNIFKKERKYSKEEVDDIIKATIVGTTEGIMDWMQSGNLKIRYVKSKKPVLGAEIHMDKSERDVDSFVYDNLREKGINFHVRD